MLQTRRLLSFAFLAGTSLWLGSCDSQNSEPDPTDPGFDRSEMLANIGNHLIIPAYQAFQEAVHSLDIASGAFVSDPTTATLTALQEALKAARLAWQDVNLFQFGPAESVALRGALNVYPTAVEQIEDNMASGDYTLGTVANLAAGGFPALDYLLHGLGNTTEETLASYTTDSLRQQRIEYLQANTAFIKAHTDATVDEWLPGGGDYITTFLSEDRAGVDVGSSLGQLVNALILHYERFLRDGKIGIPAGVRSSGIPRPIATEAYYAGYSLELAIANMRAVDRLLQGTGRNGQAGIGLEENLRSIGAADLADDINTTLAECLAALEALNDPLSDQIETDLDPVLFAFTEMQQLVVLLKADMASLLGISITFQDNDGD